MSQQTFSQFKKLGRGLSILSDCWDSRSGLKVVEIAESTALALFKVYRFLLTLEAQSCLSIDTETRSIVGESAVQGLVWITPSLARGTLLCGSGYLLLSNPIARVRPSIRQYYRAIGCYWCRKLKV
ncbi:MAG: hypothetical protein CMD54_06365 [Gammaproteobacteria bacterium]|nr:hypothetical protein [Gammaproteobacteria bacterium]